MLCCIGEARRRASFMISRVGTTHADRKGDSRPGRWLVIGFDMTNRVLDSGKCRDRSRAVAGMRPRAPPQSTHLLKLF